LKEQKLGDTKKNKSHDVTNYAKTLKDNNLNQMTAHRWQRESDLSGCHDDTQFSKKELVPRWHQLSEC